MKTITLIPFSGFLLLCLIIMHLTQIDLSVGTIASILTIVVSFVVLAVEFFKSGDITFRVFVLDITFSVVVLVIGTWLFSYLFIRGMKVYFVDFMVYAILLLDSWMSPVNAFRTALRNLQIGDSGHTV